MQIKRRGAAPPSGRPDRRVFWLSVRVGGRRVRCSLRTRDHRVAMERAAQIVAREERRSLGLEDPLREHLMRPIREHAADFESMLRADGASKEHLRDRHKALADFIDYAKVKRLADLDAAAAARWLNALTGEGLSARTVNKRAQVLEQFGKWAHLRRRIDHNPLAGLPRQPEKEDRRHPRRAVMFEEFRRLLKATAARPLEAARRHRVHAGVSTREERRLRDLGQTRVFVYLLAATTGLRRNELSGLLWGEIDLENGVATIPATRTKSGEDQKVLLHAPVVAMLRARRPTDAGPRDLVIPRQHFPNMRTYRRDLEAAGIAYVDGSSRYADFHALRTTLVTWLQVTGSMPQEAQRVARHAKLETTMKHYTDPSLFNVRGALERLPPLTDAEGEGT